MTPTQFLTELESIRLWLEEEEKNLDKEYLEYIGFYASTNSKDKFKALTKGYWSSLFFCRFTDGVSIASRILPKSKFKDWPIQQNTEGDYSYTIANNLSNFIAFAKLRILISKNLFRNVSSEWDIYLHLITPFLNLLESHKQLEFIKNYAFNPKNQPVSNEYKDNVINYLKFWFHYDTSPAHKIMRELIDNLNNDSKWIPESMPKGNLGIWETRIKNMLMSKAYLTTSRNDFAKNKIFLWDGYKQPHGYDFSDNNFSHYPPAERSKNGTNRFAGVINAYATENNDPEIVNHPLYKTLAPLRKDFNGYQGEEHYQAALELIAQNKPLEAWNALVSASYWAGANRQSDYVEKHWQTAIELCKNQNWEDAYDALTTQWEWYRNYKPANP